MKKILLSLIALFILIPSICFAYVDTGQQNYTNLELKYPIVYLKDEAIQNKINTDIANYVYNFKGQFDAGQFYSGKMSYEVKYEDDKYVSFTLKTYWYNPGAAHGMYTTYGLVYDKITGEKVPVSNFIPIKSTQQIELALNTNVLKLYNQSMKQIKNNFSHVKRISIDYFLAGNGKIYLIYQPYELASFADGNTYIEFTPEAIDYFNRMN